MMTGAILNPVNSSIIAVALAPIGAALGADASETAWLISALYLATSIGQPLAGRLVDMYGPRRLFLAGAALTGIAGVLGTLAPNLGVLVAARVILGFGTCAGYPAAMYLIRSEADRTGMKSPAGVLTALAVATQTIAVVGPTLGGLLIGVGGWRSTFAVNIPLAIACLVLGLLFLPAHLPAQAAPAETAPAQAAPARTPGVPARTPGTPARTPGAPARTPGAPPARARIDAVGILLFAATLVSLLLFLMDTRLDRVWLLAVTVLAGAGFALRELRATDPFIDVRVFAGNVPLLATYARTLAGYTVSYAFIYGFTQWLEDGRGLSASAAGLVLLPTFAVGIVVSALTGGRAAVLGKLVVGAAVQLAACALLLVLGDHTAVWILVTVTALLGLPQGLISLANQNALYHQADPARMGASSGLLRTFMYLGAMVSSSATGAFFGRRATTEGLHGLAVFMLAAAAVLLVLTVADRSLAVPAARETAGAGRAS
ncbi:MFS transporter [Streptomyces sp. NPDC059396]|uniref:MFS transporter n=1 Tax=Streptomyces sp. NPDC059396 TaxID=3346819 RepID=UPI0036873BD0